MNLENIKNNKVRTILQFSIPSIITMLLTSLITITDGFFIGNYVGKDGLAALNLGLPIIYLFISCRWAYDISWGHSNRNNIIWWRKY